MEAGHGPLVVLLHDFAQYWWSWRHQLTELPASGFRVLAPDLRGYGDSDKTPRGYDALTQAADIAGLIRACGERSAVLVGQGYGGLTAFNTAVLHPGQVRGVVALAAPHPASLATRSNRAGRAGRLVRWASVPVWPRRQMRTGAAVMVERLLRSSAGPAWKASSDFSTAASRMRRAMLVPGVAGAAVEHLAWLGRSPWRADGRRHREALAVPLRTPVLQVVGDGDPFTPPELVGLAREHCLDDYRLVTLPGVGHYPAEESPEAVTRLIAEFAGAPVRQVG